MNAHEYLLTTTARKPPGRQAPQPATCQLVQKCSGHKGKWTSGYSTRGRMCTSEWQQKSVVEGWQTCVLVFQSESHGAIASRCGFGARMITTIILWFLWCSPDFFPVVLCSVGCKFCRGAFS